MNVMRLSVVLFLLVGMTVPGYGLAATKKPGTLEELAFYNGTDRQQILEEGAKKEGQLTFYTSGALKQAVTPTVESFRKKYPFIKVDVWRNDPMQLIPRITEEFRGSSHIVDVIEGSQIVMVVLQTGGLVQPFFSPNLTQMEEETMYKAAGAGVLFVGFRIAGIGFGYNTKMLNKDQLPKSYQDLANPKWKRKLVIGGGDLGIGWVGAIYRHHGEELMKKIADQDYPVQVVSATTLNELIIAGEYAACPTMTETTVFEAKLRGAPVSWVALEPVRVNVGGIGVAKKAPHPHAALLFADFEMSKETGEFYRSMGYGSGRKDVPPVAQKYKIYLGPSTAEEMKKDNDMFQRLFLKR